MNLTRTAQYFRIGVKALAAFVVLYYVLILVIIPIGTSALYLIIPEKDPINPLYGQLDALEFVEKPLLNETARYKLDTKDGKLPALPRKAAVIKFKKPALALQAGKDAQVTAEALGFTEQDLTSDLKGTVYTWKSVESGGNLSINIDTKEISLKTNLMGRNSQFPAGAITANGAADNAKNLLNITDRFADDAYRAGNQVTYLGRFSSTKIVETKTERDAQIARVDFFRSAYKLPILGPDPKVGLISMWLKRPAGKSPYNYPKLQATYWELEGPSNSLYPLLPINIAWQEVSKGNGVVVSATPKEASPFDDYLPVRADNIFVNTIYLAYYENTKWQQYLQPIYVFEGTYTSTVGGSGTIVLYYPALDGQYIKSTSK
jgi:hypothetical protein